jgi:hypothetical protein
MVVSSGLFFSLMIGLIKPFLIMILSFFGPGVLDFTDLGFGYSRL